MAKPIRVMKQRHNWDCGVASLAMLLDKPYGDVAALVRDNIDAKKLHKRGMIIKDIELIANLLGYEVEVIWRKKDYLEGKTGIIGLKGGKMDKAGHWAVLKEGNVIADPDDGKLYGVEEYKKSNQCVTTVLLVIRK